MLLLGYILASLCVASCTLTFRPAGWLDRMVAYHKKLFLHDVDKMPPEPIRATIGKAPPGYVDPPTWDFESVMRLITLVHESEQARPVRDAIRRAMWPTRRLYVGEGRNTFKLFPSLAKGQDIYYDFSSEEIYAEDPPSGSGPITDDSIIIVANPVESRLPSAHISVRLLKEIMEARALAAREMPSTTTSTILWTTRNSTGDATAASGADTTAGGETAAGETTAGAAGGETTAGETTADGETTAAGETTAGETTAGGEDTPAAEETTTVAP